MRSRKAVALLLTVGLVVLALGLCLTACSSSDVTDETPVTTAAPTTTVTTTTTTSAPTTTTTAPPTTTTTTTTVPVVLAEIERTDYLTFANGALFISQTGLASGSASTALQVVDGNPDTRTVSIDRDPPVEFVYELPIETTFDRFAIPTIEERAGNATFFRDVEIAGSTEGPDTGYEVLVTAALETHGPDETVTELVPDLQIPVRWIRLRLENGINVEAGDEGKTNLEFSELIGNGTQPTLPLSDAFTGIWDLRLAERTDIKGTPLELKQVGTTISGCLGTVNITGTVNGSIARATGIDTRDDRPSAYILLPDGKGGLQGVVSSNGSIFGAKVAVVDPDVTSTPCSETPPIPLACGSIVYVNFDVNSAEIRPESDAVLDDLFTGLLAEGAVAITVVGHTSTEGTDEYNLDLSQRRAQAVVDDLVARGIDAGTISSVGKGETAPLLAPDRDESARAINRRVEIECG